jgi:hypothetical protein
VVFFGEREAMPLHSDENAVDKAPHVASGLARARSRTFIVTVAVTIGIMSALGAYVYRRIWHADWTGAQALDVLWPYYMVSGLAFVAAWFFRDPGR